MPIDDEKLLQELEEQGLLSKGTVARLRAVSRVTDAAGKKRALIVVGVVGMLATCLLTGVSIWAPWNWLSTPIGMLALMAFVSAVISLICAYDD